jgi:hypothetical protein
VAGTRLLLTAGAAASEVNMIVLDLEFSGVNLGPRDVVKPWILNIDNPPATQADEVVMPAELGVEARRRAWVAGLGDQAEGDERVQDAMNGHPGDLGQFATHSSIELLGGGVVGAFEYGFKDRAALTGDR